MLLKNHGAFILIYQHKALGIYIYKTHTYTQNTNKKKKSAYRRACFLLTIKHHNLSKYNINFFFPIFSCSILTYEMA